MTIQQLKDLFAKYRFGANATYGQHFLLDEIVLQDMLDEAKIGKRDAVLEIGPGIGNLTGQLLSKAGFVLSVEKDKKFVRILGDLAKQHPHFHYEIADILQYNFQEFFQSHGHKSYKVVANIPYYITGKIIQMLLAAKHKPTSITLLVQKEVARNLAAEPGNLNILAISVQLYGDVQFVQKVLARSFFPAPKVDSAVVHIAVHDKPKYEIQDEKKFFGTVKACFSGKRKQIHNTLAANLKISKDEAGKLLESVGISPSARPQDVTIEQWVSLVNAISNIKNQISK
jgi:16S rRNA (adenine1518-N6/adenine1519-N6)-dimethyltransferase